ARDERAPVATKLRREGAPQHPPCPRDPGRVVHAGSGSVRGAVELRQQVPDQYRMTVVGGVATLERVLGALAEHGGGGHVPAGFAEDALVEPPAGDRPAARRGW